MWNFQPVNSLEVKRGRKVFRDIYDYQVVWVTCFVLLIPSPLSLSLTPPCLDCDAKKEKSTPRGPFQTEQRLELLSGLELAKSVVRKGSVGQGGNT
jgi:hypothetical protein